MISIPSYDRRSADRRPDDDRQIVKQINRTLLVASRIRLAVVVFIAGSVLLSTSSTGECGQAPGAEADSASETKKLATPDAEAQTAARKTVRDGLKAEYAQAKKTGKNVEPKISLAKSLMARALTGNEDPAPSYVMLSDAAEFAAEAGQLKLAWEILTALDDRFDSPPLTLMERAAKTATRFAKSDEDIAFLGSIYVLLLDQAVRIDDFETAVKAASTAVTATRKIPVLKEQLVTYAKRINLLQEDFESAKDARDKLKSDPDDANANLMWGRYVCFNKADWQAGLPFLAKSSHATLSPLAQRDIAQSKELQELTKLGDDWWAAAELEKDPIKSTIRERAGEVWQSALQLASGVQIQVLQSKIEALFKPTKIFDLKGSAEGVIVAPPGLNPGPRFTVEFWFISRAPTGLLLKKYRDAGDPYFALALGAGNMQVAYAPPRSSVTEQRSVQRFDDGRWHHVAAVKIGRQMGMYVDGKLAAQILVGNEIASGAPWHLGSDGELAKADSEAKVCRLRFSQDARYLVNFHPEKNYPKDKIAAFIP